MQALPANFWRLLASSAASNLADGLFYIALPLIALRITDSPALIAGVALVGRLPWLVFVLVAGALADRLDRRSTMRNVQIFRVALLGLLAVLAFADLLSLPILYVASFVLGMGETLFDTSAQSILPSIVGRDQLASANGRLQGVELVMNTFVGPPLGGLLISISVPLVLASSVLGYAIAAVGLSLLVGSFRPERADPSTRLTAEIGEGLRYLWGNRVLRTLAFMVGVMNLASMASMTLLPLYAVSPGPMGMSEAGFGLLFTTFAAGSVVGSFVAAPLERRVGRVPLLFTGVVALALSFAVPAFTAEVVPIGLSFVVSGLLVVVWNVITVSLRQRIVPDRLLGRVNAAYRLFAWGTQPLGALVGGVVGELWGVQAAFVTSAVLILALLVARIVITEDALREAEGAAPAVAAA